MFLWATEIKAINPQDGELVTWAGPIIEAPSEKLAEQYCQMNGLGYCKIAGLAIGEIITDERGNSTHIDYYSTYWN